MRFRKVFWRKLFVLALCLWVLALSWWEVGSNSQWKIFKIGVKASKKLCKSFLVKMINFQLILSHRASKFIGWSKKKHRWQKIFTFNWTLSNFRSETFLNFSYGILCLKVEINWMTIWEGKTRRWSLERDTFRVNKHLRMFCNVDIVILWGSKLKEFSEVRQCHSYRYCWTSSLALYSSSSCAKIVLQLAKQC